MEQQQSGKPNRLGKYELLERLGQGGMGEVWKARDTQLQRYVAIKLLRNELRNDPDFIAHFMREARLVAALHHPNIVQIHDFQLTGGDEKGIPAYMVMDYIEGGTLEKAIRNTVRKGIFWSGKDVVDLFATIGLALDYAHQQSMIHRDIKPANILLDQSLMPGRSPGVPILTDFGIARRQDSGSTTIVKFVGTPLYISPEQAQNRPVDARSDLYSLGVVLYEMLTGITPFRGNNAMSIMFQHVNEQPPSPASVNPLLSPALSKMVLQSIAKDPQERFPSATALTLALAQAFGLPVPTLLGNQTKEPEILTQKLFPERSEVTSGFSIFDVPTSSLPLAPVSGGPPESHSPLVQPVLREDRKAFAANEALRQTPAANFIGTPVWPPQLVTRWKPGLFSRKWLLAASLGCVTLLLLGLCTAVMASHRSSTAGTSSSAVRGGSVGQLHFLTTSSTAKGIFNRVQLDLNNVPVLPAGKVYYAWLLQADSESPILPHWLLQVNNGAIHHVYTSVSPHTNLLAGSNLFLITAENASSPPVIPSPLPTWHYYYALLVQTGVASPTFVVQNCPTSAIDSATNPCR